MRVVQATRDDVDDALVAKVGVTSLQNWFLEIIPPGAFNAGKKAFDDVNSILKTHGFRSILLNRDRSSVRRVLTAPLSWFRLARVLMNPGNAVLVQTPLPLEAKSFVKIILPFRRAKVLMLLHDIDSMRYPDKLHEVRSEMELLGAADVIICHNTSMKKWLRDRGYAKPIAELTFFDYLVHAEPATKPIQAADVGLLDWRREIVFAGSLSRDKSGFLYALPDDYAGCIRVFGTPVNADFPARIRYGGRFPPDKPTLPRGLFGLVWGGPDVSTCSGVSGNYLKINSPHKVSLYLACGMPVICWRGSAAAKEIEARQLGFSVNSLREVPDTLAGLSASAYDSMLGRVESMGRAIRQGKQLMNALDRAMLYNL